MSDQNIIMSRKYKIIKHYTWDSLLEDRGTIKARLRKIELFSKQCDSVPTIEFETNKAGVTYNQVKVAIDKTTLINTSDLAQELYTLAEALEKMTNLDLVHGDINSKNVILSNRKFNIVDFEPSLRQVKKGRNVWMTTSPYISLKDIKLDTISSRTDKIGFYYFVSRLIGKLKTHNISELIRLRIHNKIDTLPINEHQLDDFCFRDILELALNQK